MALTIYDEKPTVIRLPDGRIFVGVFVREEIAIDEYDEYVVRESDEDTQEGRPPKTLPEGQ